MTPLHLAVANDQVGVRGRYISPHVGYPLSPTRTKVYIDGQKVYWRGVMSIVTRMRLYKKVQSETSESQGLIQQYARPLKRIDPLFSSFFYYLILDDQPARRRAAPRPLRRERLPAGRPGPDLPPPDRRNGRRAHGCAPACGRTPGRPKRGRRGTCNVYTHQ